MRTLPFFQFILLLAIVTGQSSCDRNSSDATGAGRLAGEELQKAIAYRNPDAEAFYLERPEFFVNKAAGDLPSNLQWDNGMNQEIFSSPKAKRGGEERVPILDYPRTLRKVGPDSANSFRSFIHDNLDLTLVKKHPNTGRYYPALAKEWAVSEDRKTVYFRIDPDARFSDGVPVQSHHFKFNFYFMQSEWIQAPWYNNWYSEKYTHFHTYDDLTFSVGLKDAKPDTLRFFEEDLFPLPEHFYNEFDADYLTKYAWRFEPTTGAYEIRPEDIKKGRTITQTRIKNWWADDKKFWKNRYNADTKEFTVVRSPDKALEAFLAGDFEMYRIRTPDVWEEKLDNPNVHNGYIIRTQYYNQVPRPCYSLRINKSKPFLENLDVRIGLQHAANFDSVLKNYFRGQYARMNTSSDGYAEFTNPNIRARPFSVEEARKHFAKAGFDKAGPDGVLQNKDGTRLSFTITTGYRRLQDVLAILQQEAAKAGVEIKLDILEPTAAWKKIQEKKHEITLTALNRSVEAYPRYWDFWHSFNAYREDGSLKSETNNFTVTANPEWDKLIDRYEASTSFAEIKEIALQLEQMIHDDAAFIPGWVRPYFQCAYWRWVQWPETFAGRLVKEHDDLSVHWIDLDIKAETLAAKKDGKTFPMETRIFDEYKIQ